MRPVALAVSIVIYRSDAALLHRVIAALAAAAANAGQAVELTLVDNALDGDGAHVVANLPEEIRDRLARICVLAGHGNIGFGAAHNLAITASQSAFHLILNPDAVLRESALTRAFEFFAAHAEVILLTPLIRGGGGELQFLCRRYPSVFDLFLRGFAPAFLRRRFTRRLKHYEMQDLIDASHVVFDPPLVSGCFMMFRSAALKRLAGFDARYFLYFEDYDLSLRAALEGRSAYVPQVEIVHYGGGAARKGWRHILMFMRSARLFFHTHGWVWW